MIRDMAYFEALFNEMLNDKKAKVETLEGLKKGFEKPLLTSVYRFWVIEIITKIAILPQNVLRLALLHKNQC